VYGPLHPEQEPTEEAKHALTYALRPFAWTCIRAYWRQRGDLSYNRDLCHEHNSWRSCMRWNRATQGRVDTRWQHSYDNRDNNRGDRGGGDGGRKGPHLRLLCRSNAREGDEERRGKVRSQ